MAEGLTNAELAQRLFISPRTAAVHVSNILRKLGVTSRTEVGRALTRLTTLCVVMHGSRCRDQRFVP